MLLFDGMKHVNVVLRGSLMTAPILALLTGSGDYVVYTDASKQRLGCVLM